MLQQRHEWRGDQNKRAKKRLETIEISIAALADEDLLDLADIFIGSPETPIAEITAAEMSCRGISLLADPSPTVTPHHPSSLRQTLAACWQPPAASSRTAI